MAKKRTRFRSSSPHGRDASPIARPPRGLPREDFLPSFDDLALSSPLPRLRTLPRPVLDLPDGRFFSPQTSPLDHPPARRLDFTGATVEVSRPGRFTSSSELPARLNFRQAGQVVVCVRRAVRREVFHARKLAGGRGFKKPRRGPYSSISCKR